MSSSRVVAGAAGAAAGAASTGVDATTTGAGAAAAAAGFAAAAFLAFAGAAAAGAAATGAGAATGASSFFATLRAAVLAGVAVLIIPVAEEETEDILRGVIPDQLASPGRQFWTAAGPNFVSDPPAGPPPEFFGIEVRRGGARHRHDLRSTPVHPSKGSAKFGSSPPLQ